MYLDSAILVKLPVREPDSDWFNRHLVGQSFESSELALTEVRPALLAKERAGHISPRERLMAGEKLLATAENDLICLLPLNRGVLDRASAVQQACHPRIPLRTLDALHVAICDLRGCATLSTMDHRLRTVGHRPVSRET